MINTSSVGATVTMLGFSAYGSSKTAVNRFVSSFLVSRLNFVREMEADFGWHI